ncbi:hypothetical protein [Streptomyces sp. SP18BB07]|uniref:hypothetical protein n=1 Tax=Streptomyces sp. SP18BB07 TaxID=3002522 RepID=UPI002E75DBCA|nr:hypothetical protein [Streptomyces sp. SP18BB07]MEE1761291.1 hypothetical protein [Streptomyces sp. SP18BB07]
MMISGVRTTSLRGLHVRVEAGLGWACRILATWRPPGGRPQSGLLDHARLRPSCTGGGVRSVVAVPVVAVPVVVSCAVRAVL